MGFIKRALIGFGDKGQPFLERWFVSTLIVFSVAIVVGSIIGGVFILASGASVIWKSSVALVFMIWLGAFVAIAPSPNMCRPSE